MSYWVGLPLQNGSDVRIRVEHIVAIVGTIRENYATVHVTGGATFPIAMSVEEIKTLIGKTGTD